jgi:cytidylate kinase
VEERLTRLGEAKPPLLDRLAAETQTYIAVMQSAVYEAARRDRIVLLGRGGQWLLRDIPHVLRVRVIAPFDLRIRRRAESFASQTGRPPAAPAAQGAVADLVRRDDADKTGRMRYLYERHIDDPELYDLMVSTERIDSEGAAEVIAGLARRPSLATTKPGEQRIADRALAARVLVTLLSNEASRPFRHERVEAESGVVRVVTGAPQDVVDAVARTVDGVTDVQFVEVPMLPPIPLV